MIKLCLLIFICLVIQNSSCAQIIDSNQQFTYMVAENYEIIKEKCNCDVMGYKIRLRVGHPSDDNQNCTYSLSAIIRAKDSLKISVLYYLLKMANDTGLCCIA